MSLLTEVSDSLNNCVVLHDILFDRQFVDSSFISLKQLDCGDFPVMSELNFREPSLLHRKRIVILSFPFMTRFIFERQSAIMKSFIKKTVLSVLNMFLGHSHSKVGLFRQSIGKKVNIHDGFLSADFYRFLKFESQPLLAVNTLIPSDCANDLAVSFNMKSPTGTFCPL